MKVIPGKGKVIGFKIEKDRPEDTPKALAIQLAGALQNEMNARTDAKEFKGQASRERQKARDFGNTLIMLGEYKRKKKKSIEAGNEWKPSRMETMESYDEKMIRDERVMLIERAKSLDDLACEYEVMANDAKLKASDIQKRLIEVAGK